MKTTVSIFVFVFAVMSAYAQSQTDYYTVYVLFKFVTPLELASIFYALGGITSVGEDGLSFTPKNFVLYQNYPNPFNPLTIINYQLPIGNWVMLTVYDLLGREVATLVDGELSAGEHSVVFDANGLASGVSSKGGYASGVYFYRLVASGFVETKKMILAR